MYASPLIFTALGGAISENAGIINIGLEGMMTIGAFVGTAVGYFTKNPWLGFLAGGLAGALLALLHAIASISFKSDQVVSGIAINFIGPGLALFLSRKLFKGATNTMPVPLEHKIPKLFTVLNIDINTSSPINTIFNQDLAVIIALILTVVIWFVFYKTKYGLYIRTVGEHPKAADSLGISIVKVRYIAVILSGVLSGFGGATMTLAVASSFTPTIISGQGFIALAAVIFGRWKPQGVLLGALVFGAAQALAITLGGTNINISSQILAMIPYILTLIILISFKGNTSSPKALGEVYEKGQR